ncbi:MAG: GreA/GreB family elongation factor [Kiritimatiellae bacterium]|nr:GreA/GreB family elongation factor [Kiritimatiellia bacterium]MCB1101522.1 GreA/GreB family elongation factor [Kiritimatiellia bacterium]
MNKRTIVNQIIEQLRIKAGLHLTAAKSAHAEATHEEAVAEDKYDTRGLEASYLAAGQARQMEETAAAIQAYASLFVKKFSPGDPVDLTALVTLEVNRERQVVFIGPAGGGVEVQAGKTSVLVITPQSPLGTLLMGKKKGDVFTRTVGPFDDQYRVVSIA